MSPTNSMKLRDPIDTVPGQSTKAGKYAKFSVGSISTSGTESRATMRAISSITYMSVPRGRWCPCSLVPPAMGSTTTTSPSRIFFASGQVISDNRVAAMLGLPHEFQYGSGEDQGPVFLAGHRLEKQFQFLALRIRSHFRSEGYVRTETEPGRTQLVQGGPEGRQVADGRGLEIDVRIVLEPRDVLHHAFARVGSA